MLRQLEEAENELKKKQDDADQDMMMAGMVRGRGQGCSLGRTPPPPDAQFL
jgi:laminin gamma 1